MDQMQPAGAPAQPGNLPAPNPEIMSPIVQAHMDELEQMQALLDGDLGDAYDRVLTAGMKMLYSAENSQVVTQLIEDQEIPMANKLGEGVANLLVMMDNQGNGTIPKEVLVPVGVALLFEAADFMFELGIEVTDTDLSDALELMVRAVFVGYGVDPEMIEKVVDDMAAKLGFDETETGKKLAEGPAPEPETAPAPVSEEAAFEQGFAAEQAARGEV